MESFQIVPIQQIHQLVEPLATALLSPLGFEVQKPLYWQRSVDAPIRQIFCIRQWKGGAAAPAWGLSLDFVPHVSGGTVKWHRTAKSALLDLTFDARDRSLDISYFRGPEHVASAALDVLPRAVERARAFWDRARSVPDLPKAFEEVKVHLSTGGLGFYNYVQHPIAYAFALAVNGHGNAAMAELERTSCASESAKEKLLALLVAAGATEMGSGA